MTERKKKKNERQNIPSNVMTCLSVGVPLKHQLCFNSTACSFLQFLSYLMSDGLPLKRSVALSS